MLTRLESANRAGQAAVFWIHPWEIDPDPPRVRLPWAKRFAHYFQLQGFKQRFEEVVAHGNFGPVGELASAR